MHRKKGTPEGAMKAQANYDEWKKLNDFLMRPEIAEFIVAKHEKNAGNQPVKTS